MNTLNNIIYLDCSATSPVKKEVLERIRNVDLTFWGNPSSLHVHGIKAAEIVERSRKLIADSLGALHEEVIFTSGATESVYLAIVGSSRSLKPGRIVISSVEHPAVRYAADSLRKVGWEIVYWPVDTYGKIIISELDRLLTPPTRLVSIIWGQSEVGTLQPINTIGQACKDRGIFFHTDATQILSQYKFTWNELPVDLLSASAHKFQGPKGIGLLLSRRANKNLIEPVQMGGGQEGGLRSGTPAVSLISGMAQAIKLLNSPLQHVNQDLLTEYQKVSYYTEQLRKELSKFSFIKFTGHPRQRLKNHISMIVGTSDNKPINGRKLVRRLSDNGICASSGSACSSSSNKDSLILTAMNIPPLWRQSGLRLSLGSWLRDKDIEIIPTIIKESILSLE